MAREITVSLPDTPGTFARLGEVLGEAQVNIEAVMLMSRGGRSTVQFVASNSDAAAQALDAAGVPHTERDVIVVNVLNEPGAMGDVALVMSSAGINIDSVYGMVDGRVVFGVDDVLGAVEVAQGMAVM
jgi:hypothetical protein